MSEERNRRLILSDMESLRAMIDSMDQYDSNAPISELVSPLLRGRPEPIVTTGTENLQHLTAIDL
jgi:hypothetical protein